MYYMQGINHHYSNYSTPNGAVLNIYTTVTAVEVFFSLIGVSDV